MPVSVLAIEDAVAAFSVVVAAVIGLVSEELAGG